MASGKAVWILLGGVCLAFGAVLIGSMLRTRDSVPAPVPPQESVSNPKQVAAVEDEGYVGSQKCAKCHPQVFDAYQQHPMGRSLTTPLAATPIERTDVTEFSPPGHRKYRIERTKEGVKHHEILTDTNGEVVYDQAVDVSFVMGSGKRGRAYLIEQDGKIFKSPVAWFSTIQEWGLSPGYPPEEHKRFERRITDGCINCHTGHMAFRRDAQDTFVKPVVLEAAIGCEKCHGPGKKHAELHKSAEYEAFDDEQIVNPARLDPARRDSICAQCHLHGKATVIRTGQKTFDFKPGQLLEDNRIVFVAPPGTTNKSATAALSQVEQMEASVCYQKSEGRLGCTSCHDPHRLPTPEKRDEFYRAKCMACHEKQGCSMPVQERLAKSSTDSCQTCHMPPALHVGNILHVAFSDHRILRTPDTSSPESVTEARDSSDYAIYHQAEQRLPKVEIDRAVAFMLVGGSDGRTPTPAQARRAEQLLLSVHEAQPKDIDTLEVLAVACMAQRKPRDTERWLSDALVIDPQREASLLNLALYYHDRQELESAKEFLQRYVAVNSRHGMAYGRLAGTLSLLGETQAAISAGERALEINPTLITLHEWLALLYDQSGKPAEAERHRKLFQKMRKLLKAG